MFEHAFLIQAGWWQERATTVCILYTYENAVHWAPQAACSGACRKIDRKSSMHTACGGMECGVWGGAGRGRTGRERASSYRGQAGVLLHGRNTHARRQRHTHTHAQVPDINLKTDTIKLTCAWPRHASRTCREASCGPGLQVDTCTRPSARTNTHTPHTPHTHTPHTLTSVTPRAGT